MALEQFGMCCLIREEHVLGKIWPWSILLITATIHVFYNWFAKLGQEGNTEAENPIISFHNNTCQLKKWKRSEYAKTDICKYDKDSQSL